MNEQFEFLTYLEDHIDKLQSALECLERHDMVPLSVKRTLETTTRAALQGALEEYTQRKRAIKKGEHATQNGRSYDIARPQPPAANRILGQKI